MSTFFPPFGTLAPLQPLAPLDNTQTVQLGPGITGTFHGDPNALDMIDLSQGGIPVPLAGARPDGSTTSTPTAAPSTGILGGVGTAVSGAVSGAVKDAFSSFFGDAQNALSSRILDAVAIAAGLLLLAGAVFGFRSVQTTVVQAAKKGAEVAAL